MGGASLTIHLMVNALQVQIKLFRTLLTFRRLKVTGGWFVVSTAARRVGLVLMTGIPVSTPGTRSSMTAGSTTQPTAVAMTPSALQISLLQFLMPPCLRRALFSWIMMMHLSYHRLRSGTLFLSLATTLCL